MFKKLHPDSKSVFLHAFLFLSFAFPILTTTPVAGQASTELRQAGRPSRLTLERGRSLAFNGVDNFVQVYQDARLSLQVPMSVEAWVYLKDWSANPALATGIISRSEHGAGGYELSLDSNGTRNITFHARCDNIASPTVTFPRTAIGPGWHHIVSTLAADGLRLYIDGVLVATTPTTAACQLSYPYNFEMRFGRSARNDGSGRNYFRGRLDDVRLYRAALTPTQIDQRFNRGLGNLENSFPEILVAGWHFDEGLGASAEDFSGNGLLASLINFPVWAPRRVAEQKVDGVFASSVTPTSAILNWLTGSAVGSVIEWGPTSNLGSRMTASAVAGIDHTAALSDLQPNTTYFYRVKAADTAGGELMSKIYKFRTLDLPPTNGQYFAAPNGRRSNNGSYTNPFDLQTILSGIVPIPPGSTIWLRGGRYVVPPAEGSFVSNLNGTAGAPITIRSYPGEWAVLDGNMARFPIKNRTLLQIFGAYTQFIGFEITNSDPENRIIPVTSSNPFQRRGNSIDDYGVGTKLINLVIHDTGQGIGAWQVGRDNEYYGNIVYNNGWDAPDRLHGHGTYVQNEAGTKRFAENLLFNQFSANSRTGGTSASSVRNLTWEGNVFFNGSMAWLGPNFENLVVRENFTFRQPFKVGWEVNSTYINADIRNNYLMSGVELFQFAGGLRFENNTVWSTDGTQKNIVYSTSTCTIPTNLSFANNLYYHSIREWPFWQFRINCPGTQTGDYAFNKFQGSQASTYNYTRKSWQDDLRLDTTSTFVDAVPTENRIFVRRNAYDPNRAHVIVYNWRLDGVVEINPGQLLANGEEYELRNVQDYFGDVMTGVYNGQSIQIPMTNRSLAKPIGYDAVKTWYHDPLQPSTFPQFGVFVLIRRQTSFERPETLPPINFGASKTEDSGILNWLR